MLKTAVAYIIFNRPRHTRRTFAAIRAQQPERLFIIADGPRKEHPEDVELCNEVRGILEEIDWPCEVHRNFADENLGLKRRVSSGLNWVFDQVEKAIVLEDDCLPHPDFFTFCETLLDYYEKDNRVWVITGNNFQDGKKRGNASYYFSKYNHCWGWASWRRAWKHYQGHLPFWPEWQQEKKWERMVPSQDEQRYWAKIFDRVKRGEIDSWAYPWTGSVWYHEGITATPNVNLVTNIGFGPDGTHTVSSQDREGLPVYPLGKLSHPRSVGCNRRADRFVFHRVFLGQQKKTLRDIFETLPKRVGRKFFRLCKNCLGGWRAS